MSPRRPHDRGVDATNSIRESITRFIDSLRPQLGRRSITTRFLVIVIVAEVLFGLFAAGVVGLTSLRQAAIDHCANRRGVTHVLAQSLAGDMLPLDRGRLDVAVHAIATRKDAEIVSAMISDGGGRLLSRSAAFPGEVVDDATEGLSLRSFIVPTVMRAPITVNGRTLGTLSVLYAPIGVGEIIALPLISVVVTLFGALLFSGGWATWTMSHTVAQPVSGLRDAAAAIAEGRRDIPLPVERSDELGQLARGIEEMMLQLGVREREIIDSYRSLEGAYKWQARLKADLEAALRTRSDFLAVASHEIRSPLAVVHMYAEMLRDAEFGELKAGQREAAESIMSASERLTSIVADLLDTALLDRGIMPLRFGDVSMDEIVRGAVRDAVPFGAEHDIAIELLPGAEGVRLRGDDIRLRQVLDNLLTNAVKYSGGPSTVTVQICDDTDHCEIRVADQGPGIPYDSRDMLFEMFRRVESEDNAASSGLGLGLAISRRIAIAHGGDLTVEDNEREGRGTVFVLTLPYHGEDLEKTRIRVV